MIGSQAWTLPLSGLGQISQSSESPCPACTFTARTGTRTTQRSHPTQSPIGASSKADEVIKAQDSHLREMVAGDDEAHRSALKSMQDRWKHPLSGMGWYHKDKEGLCCSSRRLIGLPLPLL